MQHKYKYGELMISKQPSEVETVFGYKITIPAGNKVVIGFDGLAHHIKTGCIQVLPKNTVIEGFSSVGIVEALYLNLRQRLPIDEMLAAYEKEPKWFTDALYDALETIGLYKSDAWGDEPFNEL